MILNENGYLARKTTGFRSGRQGRKRRERDVKRHYRDWWLVKASKDNEDGTPGTGWIYLGDGVRLNLPSSLAGKRIKFKIEFLKGGLDGPAGYGGEE